MSAVYIASAGGRRHKIGVSTNPRRRIQGIASSSGTRLTLVHECEVADASATERMAHWLLRESHLKGEWFGVDAAAARAAVDEAVKLTAAGERAPRRIAGPGRRKEFDVRILLAVSAEMGAALDAALAPGEIRLDLIRDALDRELKRRERKPKGQP